MIWVPKAEEEGRMIKDLMTEEAAEWERLTLLPALETGKELGGGIQLDPRGWKQISADSQQANGDISHKTKGTEFSQQLNEQESPERNT